MSRFYANELFDDLRKPSEVMAALGSVTRQRILMLFQGQGKLNIKDIADRFNLSRTAVVHHIGVLQDAGILKGERVGKEMVLDVDWARIAEALNKMLDFVKPLIDSGPAIKSVSGPESPAEPDCGGAWPHAGGRK